MAEEITDHIWTWKELLMFKSGQRKLGHYRIFTHRSFNSVLMAIKSLAVSACSTFTIISPSCVILASILVEASNLMISLFSRSSTREQAQYEHRRYKPCQDPVCVIHIVSSANRLMGDCLPNTIIAALINILLYE